MEQFHPQIHEQEAESKELDQSEGMPLAELSRDRLGQNILTRSMDLRRRVMAGRRDAPKASRALAQLNELSTQLTGENTEYLELRLHESRFTKSLAKLWEMKIVDMPDQLSENEKNLRYNYFALSIHGMNTDAIWEMRRNIIEECPGMIPMVVAGLATLDTEQAWQMRAEFADKTSALDKLQGVAGIDSLRAWEVRNQFMSDDNANQLFWSLTGIDTKEAWAVRDRFEEKADPYSIANALIGLDTPRAWKMRKKHLGAIPEGQGNCSLAFLDSKSAWKIRAKLKYSLDKIMSITGIDTPRAWKMREEYLKNPASQKNYLAQSLAGLNSEQAWQMRLELNNKGTPKEQIALGLNGNFMAAVAWRYAKGLLPHQLEIKNSK